MNAPSNAVPARAFTRRTVLGSLLAVLGTAACAAGAGGPAAYGTKVRFRKNAPVEFPDFTLTYLGPRHEASPVFKNGFNFEDFKLTRGTKSSTVSWSSGTGLIAPRMFEFGGQSFSLELRHANRFSGWLKEDELVIEKK